MLAQASRFIANNNLDIYAEEKRRIFILYIKAIELEKKQIRFSVLFSLAR